MIERSGTIMNKVITINLNGNAYPIEESGYEALRAYLEHAARTLEGNPDKDEILADIEQAIADKFRAMLGPHKTVVNPMEVEKTIAEMGPVADGSAPSGQEPSAGANTKENAGTAPSEASSPRRLYCIQDGAVIGGVCNGLAAYLGKDVVIVRLIFAFLAFITGGTWILVYIIMAIAIPTAKTAAEKSAAYGAPSTAQDFIRLAKEGYYAGLRNFQSKQEYREWRRNFRRNMRGWRRNCREQMRENAHQWSRNWQESRAHHPPCYAGPYTMTPLISLLRSLLALLNCLLILASLGIAVWFIAHHTAQVHTFIDKIPPILHDTVDTIRQWWTALE